MKEGMGEGCRAPTPSLRATLHVFTNQEAPQTLSFGFFYGSLIT